jgi:two-component system sensor histidine kinase SenX3
VVEWVSVLAGALAGATAATLAILAGRRALMRRRGRDGSVIRADRGAAVNGGVQARGELARKGLESLRAAVVILDPDNIPVIVNPSARAMGLLRAGDRTGAVTAHPLVRTLAGQVRRSGVRREMEVDLPRGGAGGAAGQLSVLLRGVELGGGYVAVEGADVTESHRVARVRRDFVANVGHELKTPIGALQLLAEALLDATASTATASPNGREAAGHLAEDLAAARRFAERIQQESARLGKLVSELLELSRLQGAEPLPQPVPVSLDAVVAEAVDRVRTAAAARRIHLEVTGEQGLTAYGSESQLVTAVANLAENAVAYSPEGSRVVLTLRREDDLVAVEVADQGIGIPPEDLDRIFERFYRSDRARSRATGGTGLGLAIVKHIATNHGGRVDVTSAPGEGSTFTLRLPARPPQDSGGSPTAGGIDGEGTDGDPDRGDRPVPTVPGPEAGGPAVD